MKHRYYFAFCAGLAFGFLYLFFCSARYPGDDWQIPNWDSWQQNTRPEMFPLHVQAILLRALKLLLESGFAYVLVPAAIACGWVKLDECGKKNRHLWCLSNSILITTCFLIFLPLIALIMRCGHTESIVSPVFGYEFIHRFGDSILSIWNVTGCLLFVVASYPMLWLCRSRIKALPLTVLMVLGLVGFLGVRKDRGFPSETIADAKRHGTYRAPAQITPSQFTWKGHAYKVHEAWYEVGDDFAGYAFSFEVDGNYPERVPFEDQLSFRENYSSSNSTYGKDANLDAVLHCVDRWSGSFNVKDPPQPGELALTVRTVKE